MGASEAVDGTIISESLTRFVAERQGAKAAILKQARLAKEERNSASKKGKGKGDEE